VGVRDDQAAENVPETVTVTVTVTVVGVAVDAGVVVEMIAAVGKRSVVAMGALG